MSLNIKNGETHQLARELAQLTGETMTGAITIALREKLDRERRERSVEVRIQKLRAIHKRCRDLLKDGHPLSSMGTSSMMRTGCRIDPGYVRVVGRTLR